jgi:hypothetical protein
VLLRVPIALGSILAGYDVVKGAGCWDLLHVVQPRSLTAPIRQTLSGACVQLCCHFISAIASWSFFIPCAAMLYPA